MERKFLVCSCLMLLISIAYFIVTSYQWHIESENQQKTLAKWKATFIDDVSTRQNLQKSNPMSLNSASTVGEAETFEEARVNVEELENAAIPSQSEEFAEMVPSETKGGEIGIDPELEAMFLDIKALVDQDNEILDEMEPYVQQVLQINTRQEEILNELVAANGNREEMEILYAEFHALVDEAKSISDDIIEPYEHQRRQLRSNFERRYGLSDEEFADRYYASYRSWKQGL